MDFLIPNGYIETCLLEEDTKDPEYLPTLDSRGRVMKFWKASQQYLDTFWDLFYVHYLVGLHDRHVHTHKRPKSVASSKPEVGSVVLLQDKNVPRGHWKLGRIVAVNHRSDGEITSADVQLANRKVLCRPINLLHPLEIVSEIKLETSESEESESENTSEHINTLFENREKVTSNSFQVQNKREHTANLRGIFTCVPRGTRPLCIFSMSILLALFSCCSGTQCETDTKSMSLIVSQTCMETGYIVFQNTKQEKCYVKRNCQPKEHLTNMGECGSMCPCPSWTPHCSFHSKEQVQKDSVDTQKILQSLYPKLICSITPHDKCDPTKIDEEFPQVQLFDNSTFLIESLTLQTKQAQKDEYDCFGTGLVVTGTPEYCQEHECQTPATKFCLFLSNERTFLVTNIDQIEIKAWGSVKVPYYPYKHEVHTLNQHACFETKITCIMGGVIVDLGKNCTPGKMIVCSKPFCYPLEFPAPKQEVIFPTEISLRDYEVKVEIYDLGFKVRELGKTCEANPFCETIKCYFCKA